MANGNFMLACSSALLQGQILWSAESNGTQANTSEVTVQIQVRRSSASFKTTGTWKGNLTVGGRTETFSWFGAVSGSWVTVHTMTATVSHNADGSGSCYLYGKANGPTETSLEGIYVSGSETVMLEAIARFGYLLTAPDFHDEEDPVITYANPMGDGVKRLEVCISLSGEQDDIAYRTVSKAGGSYTFQLTENERNILRAATTGSNRRQLRFYIRTTTDSGSSLSYLTRTLTIKDPYPVLDPVVTDTNSTTKALTGDAGTMIRYFSNAQVTMNAAAVKQATLDSCKVTCGSQSLTSDGTMEQVESGTFIFTAKDSRGNVTGKILPLTLIPYFKPTCELSNEIPDGTGTMVLRASGSYFNESFGVKGNSLQVRYRYKRVGEEYGSWRSMTVTVSGNSYSAQANVTGLDYRSAYIFQICAQDALSQAYSAEKKIKANPVFDWSETDFRFRVPVDMAGCGITGLASPADTSDAVTLGFLNTLGLGAGGKHTTDLNNEKATGWYSFSSGCANAPFKFGVVLTIRRYSSDVVQLAFNPYMDTGNGKRELCLRSYTTSWGEWEYLNPPMLLGTEYRTTERNLGKPVYAKAVDFGALPASKSKTVSYSSAASTPLAVTLQLSDGCVLSAGYGRDGAFSENYGLYLDATKYGVRVRTETDFSSLTACAVVKYTKD